MNGVIKGPLAVRPGNGARRLLVGSSVQLYASCLEARKARTGAHPAHPIPARQGRRTRWRGGQRSLAVPQGAVPATQAHTLAAPPYTPTTVVITAAPAAAAPKTPLEAHAGGSRASRHFSLPIYPPTKLSGVAGVSQGGLRIFIAPGRFHLRIYKKASPPIQGAVRPEVERGDLAKIPIFENHRSPGSKDFKGELRPALSGCAAQNSGRRLLE